VIIIYNHETILHEVMRTARGRVASALGVPLAWVKFELEHREGEDAGRLFPKICVSAPSKVPDLFQSAPLFQKPQEWINETIGVIVHMAIGEYDKRWAGAQAR
jgi:hypothetical protein